MTQSMDSIITISNSITLKTIKAVRIGGRQLNRGRSDSEYLIMLLSLRECQSELSIERTGTIPIKTK